MNTFKYFQQFLFYFRSAKRLPISLSSFLLRKVLEAFACRLSYALAFFLNERVYCDNEITWNHVLLESRDHVNNFRICVTLNAHFIVNQSTLYIQKQQTQKTNPRYYNSSSWNSNNIAQRPCPSDIEWT